MDTTSFEVNREKQDALLLTAGFFASKTIGVDLDHLAAKDNYGMRDEQEKAFGFTIPDGCAPVYVSKAKPKSGKRGRPAKPKIERQDF
ncbi:MAG: hypothetical protein PHS04_12370 [Tissierellia bacterium]|nr:hypothetical protein [Tissierellia bacterium]